MDSITRIHHNQFDFIYNNTWKLIIYETNNSVSITDVGVGKILRKELLVYILIYYHPTTIEDIITILTKETISIHNKIQIGLLDDFSKYDIHAYQSILTHFNL